MKKPRNPGCGRPTSPGLTNVSDLTLEVLENIRDDIRTMKTELSTLDQRVETGFGELKTELSTLDERVDVGFAQVNSRLDSSLKISGAHHGELEVRVQRIESHLGLTSG